MNRMKPICQMILVENINNDLGLIFSSELVNDHSQSILFCIPIYYTLDETIKLEEYLQKKKIYLPFYIKGEEVTIFGQINFPFIEFDLSEYSEITKRITFLLEPNFYSRRKDDYFFTYKWNKSLIRRIKKILSRSSKHTDTEFLTLNYIGKWDKINKGATQFLVVTPTSPNALDELFRGHKIAPIGLTPKFGEFLFDNKNNTQKWL